MFNRIVGVLRLDVNTFEEIEADESATSQAAIVVGIVAVLGAIGAFIGAQAANEMLQQLGQISEFEIPFAVPELSPIGAAINAILGAFIAWALWAALTYFIGTRLFPGKATFGEMLRVIGFAQAPRMLGIFAFIPCLGGILGLVGAIWALIAGFVGVRAGLDLDTGQTLITVFISWLVAIAVNIFLIGPILALLL